MKAAIYARVSTYDQEPENQLQETEAIRPGKGLDWSGVRRPWGQRGEGSTAGARRTRTGRDAPKVRRTDLLAAGIGSGATSGT